MGSCYNRSRGILVIVGAGIANGNTGSEDRRDNNSYRKNRYSQNSTNRPKQ
jgi:hypothetical protein